METDVRVVRLIRKTIWNKNSIEDSEKRDTNDYFATDYFDIMRVEEKNLASPLTSIMGIWPYKEMGALDVIAHSYSLYCSKEMADLAEGIEKSGDPFEDPFRKMPFLSMIQVHITPEILARRPKEESAEEFIHAIYLDLQDAVGEYAENEEHRGEIFVYRIYKMLSAGDFAVVIRSDEPETSFAISSLLRRRVTANKEIVLYKTYTIFSFGDEIIERETEERQDGKDASLKKSAREDRFVLRCCYSNLYWKNREKVDLYLKKEKLHFDDKMYGLNGRYDFSVRVTKRQFIELFQDIKIYKQIETQAAVNDAEIKKSGNSQAKPDDIVKYMRYLMENHYLSYINERYLLEQDENSGGTVTNSVSPLTCVETDEKKDKRFLDQKMGVLYHSVKERYEGVCRSLKDIAVGNKNIGYYMDLLGRQLKHYYGISGFSDTRIYAAALLEQLDVIFGSIDEYASMYHGGDYEDEFEREKEKEEIRNLLEDYLRESVCALDNYAQYIRSRNLQSLQTPNYNLESSMGLEKLLIGYSEFIKAFMDFYSDRGAEKEQCRFFPVVVPALKNRDVSVENLFPKGKMDDWRQEEKIREEKSTGCDRSCVIIGVPTLMELGDVGTMATSLIHEMAHQFRYESREERNDALLQYLIHTMMREVANQLILNIENEMEIKDWNMYFGRMLEKCLVEAYTEINYKNADGKLEYFFQNAPLNNFKRCFGKDLYEVLGSWGKKNGIKSVFRAFLKKLMQHYQPEYGRCPDAVIQMDKLIETIEKRENDEIEISGEAIEDAVETIVRYAYALSYDCACYKLRRKKDYLWEGQGFDEWVHDSETDLVYEDEWERTFGNGSDADEIYQIFSNFAIWVYDNCGNGEKVKAYDSEKKTEFLKKTYQKMCAMWREERTQNELRSDCDSILSAIGRALGIDCETEKNYDLFEEKITAVVIQNLGNLDKMADWRIRKYREETADMFMCNVMNLTPFGYIYQLAVGWLKERELSNEHYSRSQNVLLFQWCLEGETGEKKLSYMKYKNLCTELLEKLREAVAQTSERLIKQGSPLEPVGNTVAPIPCDKENGQWEFELQNQIENLKEYCDTAMNACKGVCAGEEYKMLKLCGIMAHMTEQLVGCGKEHLDYLEDFCEIREDYIRGIERLSGINEEMRKRKKGNGEKDKVVNKLGEFCASMGRWQNEPYMLLGNDKEKEEMNAASIEFLLNMYYENKKRIARKAGGKRCT